jgi:murein tripeptide amidase MpaA
MFARNVIRCAFVVSLAGLAADAPAQSPGQRTPAEESAYSAYTQQAQVAGFLDAVVRAAKEARLQVVGKTAEANDFPAANLYLCVLTAEGAESPQTLNRKKPTFMLTASQHGNEQSGKEAALQLIRDLAVGDLKPLLKQMNFLVMPQANPYGNFVDKRQNEQGLDLNRVHVKLEAPETRAIHAVFTNRVCGARRA